MILEIASNQNGMRQEIQAHKKTHGPTFLPSVLSPFRSCKWGQRSKCTSCYQKHIFPPFFEARAEGFSFPRAIDRQLLVFHRQVSYYLSITPQTEVLLSFLYESSPMSEKIQPPNGGRNVSRFSSGRCTLTIVCFACFYTPTTRDARILHEPREFFIP